MNTHTEPAPSLSEFFQATAEQMSATGRFSNESARTVRIDVERSVWLKPGAAIAYRGRIHFERLHTIGAPTLEEAALRETAPLIRASGEGRLYCGYQGTHARIVRLAGESIVVSSQDLLAFEDTLAFQLQLVGHGVGIAAGGMVVVTLTGNGAFAFATHGEPLTLPVAPGQPVRTDPHATLAWSATLTPALKTDISWRSAFAHGGSEPIQMEFEGRGFVLVQPFHDPSRFSVGGNPLKKITSVAKAV